MKRFPSKVYAHLKVKTQLFEMFQPHGGHNQMEEFTNIACRGDAISACLWVKFFQFIRTSTRKSL